LWLVGFCTARGLFSTSQTTYAASLPVLKEDWGMTAGQSGLISTSFFLGFLVSLFVVGFLADRIGAKRTYLLTSVLAAASALAFALLAQDFWSAIILYGMTGLFSGGSYTPGLAILAQCFPSRGRGRAIGFYIASSSAGYAISLLLSSALLPLGGWRAAFVVTCLGPTLGMMLGAFMLRKVPNVTPRMEGEGAKASASAGGEVGREDATRQGISLPVRQRGLARLFGSLRGNKPALLIVAAYTFHSWELLGFWSWTPFFLAAVSSGAGGVAGGVTGAAAGAGFTALTYVVSIFGPITGGELSDRFGRTAVIVLLSLISTICAFTLGWLVAAPLWLAVGVAFIFQFSAIGDSPVLSTALTELVHPRQLGAAYALRSVVGFGAGAISPWVFGLVLDWGGVGSEGAALTGGDLGPSSTMVFGLAFSVLGLGGMLCPLSVLWLRRHPASVHMAGGRR
jgi:MFS family permease